jgi:hypothetical protein
MFISSTFVPLWIESIVESITIAFAADSIVDSVSNLLLDSV